MPAPDAPGFAPSLLAGGGGNPGIAAGSMSGAASASTGNTTSQHPRGTTKVIGALMNCGAMQADAFTNSKKQRELNSWFRETVRVLHVMQVHVVLLQDHLHMGFMLNVFRCCL